MKRKVVATIANTRQFYFSMIFMLTYHLRYWLLIVNSTIITKTLTHRAIKVKITF